MHNHNWRLVADFPPNELIRREESLEVYFCNTCPKVKLSLVDKPLIVFPEKRYNEGVMKYNFLKSRTFWTIVVMFCVNGYAAISGQIPSNVDMVVNFALSSLATYFHIDKQVQA